VREMRRLREETKSPLARALLESADADRSASGACGRALGTLGLGAAGIAVAKGAAGTGAGGSGAGALSAAPPSAKAGALFFLKWVGVGALGGAVAIGSAAVVQEVTTPSAVRAPLSAPTSPLARPLARATTPLLGSGEAPLSAPAAAAPLSPSAGSEVIAIAHEGTRSTSFATSATSAAPAAGAPHPPGETTPEWASATPNVAPSSSEPPPSERIPAQLQALSAIRAALAAKDPARALTLLDEFDLHNPESSLSEEVTVLRIDALTDAGRAPEAAALGGAFLKAHPRSAYGEHIRSKLKSP